MRLHLLAAVAAGLSLTQCSFSGIGLGEAGNQSSTSEPSTSGDASTSSAGDTTTASTEPTTGEVPGELCGNAQPNPGEECDNGVDNNGKFGSICREDCKKNVCGDGYVASIEGCDDGNTADGDGCSSLCVGEGCGDGKVDPETEQCDDMNMIDDDMCNNMCKLAICGDGIKHVGEQCDDGNKDDTDACTNACATAFCGDGLTQMGVEGCDDGNDVDDDECTNDCTLPGCGDGIKTADEECDDNNEADDDDCIACKLATCGDGIQNTAGTKLEECDAGADNGDTKACTSMCVKAECGDGLVQEDVDECDDGNAVDTDNCKNDCKLTKCGDGVVNQVPKEGCDDGNTDAGDGCSPTCTKECGNGIIDPGEECDDKANADIGDSCDPMCNRLRFYVFVTTDPIKAGFGGPDAADAKCNELATAAKIPGAGNYKAWISGADPGDTPDLRLVHSDKAYILLNKAKVADDWMDLTDGTLDSAINRNQANAMVADNPANCNAGTGQVWTATASDALKLGETCDDWMSEMVDMGQTGSTGLLNKKDKTWTQDCSSKCDTSARLYCFEQPPP